MTIAWLWRNRHDLARWVRFLVRLPSEAKTRDLADIFAEAQARVALSMDPRTRLAPDLDIDRFADGTVVVRTHLTKPTALVAREVVERVPGVRDVEIVDILAEPEPAELAEPEPVGASSSSPN